MQKHSSNEFNENLANYKRKEIFFNLIKGNSYCKATTSHIGQIVSFSPEIVKEITMLTMPL